QFEQRLGIGPLEILGEARLHLAEHGVLHRLEVRQAEERARLLGRAVDVDRDFHGRTPAAMPKGRSVCPCTPPGATPRRRAVPRSRQGRPRRALPCTERPRSADILDACPCATGATTSL